MHVGQILISAVLAALIVAGLGLYFGPWRDHHLLRDAMAGSEATGGHHHGHHGGGWGHRRGRGLARLCEHRSGERLDRALRWVESELAISPEQRPAWNAVVAALADGAGAIGERCARLDAEGHPETVPEMLALAETLLDDGFGAVRNLREPVDAFYETLSDAQREALEDLVAHRRR